MNELKKERKLQKNNDFRLVYKHGTFEVNRHCVIYKMPVAHQRTRIGFVTGKKVGCAVQRNRARRLMREVYRLNQHKIREGYSIVMVARQALRDIDYRQAEKSLMKLFKRCKLLVE